MPSKSKKQAKLMSAVAHNAEFAKKVGIPQSVGEEFNSADTHKTEVKKSNYGPQGTAAAAQYQPHVNQERKAANTGDVVEGIGHNKNVKSFSSKPGQLSAKQQAAREVSPARVKKLSGPVKIYSDEERAKFAASAIPPKMKKEEILDEEVDGKQEIVEGKEPLKKDPKQRWALLKKALDHKKAFMDLEEAMGEDEGDSSEQLEGNEESAQQAPQSEDGAAQDLQQELAPENDEQNTEAEGAESPPEAVSVGQEEQQPDPQELIDALKNEGYSDQEIAYIVHGHHAPEIDPTKQAKAQATSARSDLDLDNAAKMAELERQHAEQGLAAEREHKKRMSDLEFQQAQKKHALVDQDATHKQRMLDLEYERAKREAEQSDGSEGDAEAFKQMKQLEIEKKKLELQLRKEEMKMELEFKKREHELKLKMMEQQIKEQGKQKSEILGIKHEQKLAEAKSPPAKKPLKKSEEDDE